MRFFRAWRLLALGLILAVTACSSLRTTSAVKASYQEDQKEGWMARNIPGLKTLSDLIPPPNEARMKWDERQKRQGDLSGRDVPGL